MRETVVLGLSGGVDSAVAAGLLAEEYRVHCVFLDIGLGGTAAADAAAVAAKLGLSFACVDIRKALEEQVCAPFAADYLAGRTPLPCAKCNPSVKFPALLAAADRMGAKFVATGHYARTKTENGRTLLLKGMPSNDQSYMLARLPQSILRRVLFPLGDYEKAQVRALAGAEALPVAEKPDSMEICFIPDGDYAAWLDARGGTPPEGDFVDENGRVLGGHRGYHHYTIGQGRGLGISGPHRYFVCAIDPKSNRVTLSDGRNLYAHEVRCGDPNWIATPDLQDETEVTV
ncbi:MAG: tRNA 2-thiouridine(34) synthase MnmA, partial [Pseudoflavonifractor sp.]